MKRTGRAAGQVQRYNQGELDPFTLLAITVVGHAYKDAIAVTEEKGWQLFQPGIQTTEKRLKEEQAKLLEWIASADFVFWARASGMCWDKVEERREKLEGILKRGVKQQNPTRRKAKSRAKAVQAEAGAEGGLVVRPGDKMQLRQRRRVAVQSGENQGRGTMPEAQGAKQPENAGV